MISRREPPTANHWFALQEDHPQVPNEHDDIRKTAEVIAEVTGKRPPGWRRSTEIQCRGPERTRMLRAGADAHN